MARRKGEAAHIGNLLQRWIRNNRMDEQVLRHTLRARWAAVVGERLASRTRPHGLYRGRLKVRVANSTWLNELNFIKDSIVQRIGEEIGQGKVREVVLVVGELDPPPGSARREVRRPAPEVVPAPRVEVPAEVARAVEEAVGEVEDVELREAVKRAWMAELERGDEIKNKEQETKNKK